ncbi:Uncharacterized protein dnm_047680 [Desulfonema magnum]|uniref:Uncharacterized protein n=1 Tax=Desulfonema magnum TaxID=45655 RepID=A0A975GP75_9BACT|nr:Uncharacterized protein dnm_047680 [Desulfonema magnum]
MFKVFDHHSRSEPHIKADYTDYTDLEKAVQSPSSTVSICGSEAFSLFLPISE